MAKKSDNFTAKQVGEAYTGGKSDIQKDVLKVLKKECRICEKRCMTNVWDKDTHTKSRINACYHWEECRLRRIIKYVEAL